MKMRLIQPSDRIFVAGARGMAGSAIVRALKRSGYGDPAQDGALLTPNRQELDLLSDKAVCHWMTNQKPDVVVLAAQLSEALRPTAAVQRISCSEPANRNSGDRNRLACRNAAVTFFRQRCIYPKFAAQPIREESLLTGAQSPQMPGMPSPRSPASNFAKRCAFSTALTQSA